MADCGKSKSPDSDKAALGRKLLNKHKKSKTARNTDGKHFRNNNEEPTHSNTGAHNNAYNLVNSGSISDTAIPELGPREVEVQQAMPIQQYFNISNNNNFFDFDRVTIDDPELKHNELYNLHKNINESNEIVDPQNLEQIVEESENRFSSIPLNVAENSSEIPVTTPNIAEISPHYDDSQYAVFELNKSVSEQQLAVDTLQSQFQQQVLTNSHILGENSQLQGELHHAHAVMAQHSDEMAELKQRIQSTEARLAETQRQVDAQRNLAEEWRTKAELEEIAVNNVRKERDVALQDASELLERLVHTQEEGERVKQVVGQLRGQLDMANIRIQQLLTTANTNIVSESSEAREKELLLEKQLSDIQVTLEATRTERDVATQQYQLYNSQLSEQVTVLQAEVVTLRSSTEQLVARERDLVAHIGDMERLLQNSHGNGGSNKDKLTHEQNTNHSIELEQLRQHCNQMTDRLRLSCTERDEALKELHHLHGIAEDLQELRNTQQADTEAQSKLLSEIRSDKVALSRAIEQNLVLKSQVAEMEAAYLAVTQDKVAPLTDQLATAKHQLQGYEKGLRTLQDAVAVKDRELEQMRCFEAQVEQLNDRLRHYEAVHEHGAPSIQVQLQQLRQENKKLRSQLSHDREESEEHDDEGSPCHHHDDHHHHHHHDRSEEVDDGKVPTTVDREDELQQEIFQLKQQLDELRIVNAELVTTPHEEEEGERNTAEQREQHQIPDDGVVTRRLSKAKAVQQLEHKFTRTMAELASLNDEKQRLEHLVLQLQSETETIGEYVALYQRQRSLLSQRTAAREAQLRHLHARLGELAQALEHGNSDKRVITDLLEEIRRSNVSDLMLEQERDEQHVGEVMEGVACGGGCAWCQGKLITV